MTEDRQTAAWNAMVMAADPAMYPPGDERRAAAIDCRYMGSANNGGLNAFLSQSHDLDAGKVLDALETLGAAEAADQLRSVLTALGAPLPVMSEEERWDRVEALWTEDLDAHDVLSDAADQSLLRALEAHAGRHIEYYFDLAG